MADNTGTYLACCCCIAVFIFFAFGSFSPDNSSTSLDDSLNNMTSVSEINDTITDFRPTNFTFEYASHNSTTYEGDEDLYGANCLNTIDNKTYRIAPSDVRAIANATNGTFEFNQTLNITRDAIQNYSSLYGICSYYVDKIYYSNGTQLEPITNTQTVETQYYSDDSDYDSESYYDEEYDY